MTRGAVVAFVGKSLLLAGIGSILTPGFGPVTAVAQAVEEHNAVPLQGPQLATLNASMFASRPQDPTPFGVTLAGLMIVDAHANGGKLVHHDANGGINTNFGGPTAQNADLRRLLAKYVGQPLSFRLLSAIQVDVTQFYRDNGRSLVSVTVPQQEITSGIVQVNVTSFVLAGKQFEGAPQASTSFLNRQLRVKPGQEVDTDQLLDDVNWLNQNPFRHVSVVFEPGQAPDSTNLTLQVQVGRTWSGYVGLSNSGTDDTGTMRVFGGANISALAWQDQQLSYQFTAAPGSLGSGHLWDAGTDKGYLSHAVSYFIPITTNSGFRTKLTFGASHISSYSVPGGVFTSGTDTTVLTGEIAFPLPKKSGAYNFVPELYAQVEYNDYDSLQYFSGIPLTANEEKTKLLHGAIGLRTGMSGMLFGKNSKGSIESSLVFGRKDTDGADASTYSYAKLSVKEEIFLPKDTSFAVRVSGQKSPDVLHPLEQMALGGDGSVRGYPVNGVTGSTAWSASVEYRLAPWSFDVGEDQGKFHPHVFADFGYAAQEDPFADQTMSSVGLGGSFEVGNNVVGTVDIAEALKAAGSTAANSPSFAFQLTARF
ncbi:MAG: ShlB/FhaC/HecB family hemolysin secretion/activation protein [bacterium]